jgi:hypothetical protein
VLGYVGLGWVKLGYVSFVGLIWVFFRMGCVVFSWVWLCWVVVALG